MHLSAKSDNAHFDILQNYGDAIYPVKIEEIEHPVSCRKIKIKFTEHKKETSAQNVYNNTQTISITGSNSGNISQTINIEQQLAQIESEIDTVKGVFNISQKKQAQQMFERFKNCITNHQKDENLFNKFIKALKDLSLDFSAKLVAELISRIFHL